MQTIFLKTMNKESKMETSINSKYITILTFLYRRNILFDKIGRKELLKRKVTQTIEFCEIGSFGNL